MGMTIDEHIAQLKKLKSFHNGSYGASVKVAIDTMRKYQKIEQIVKEWEFDHESMVDSMEKIGEVIEDGNVD